MAECLTVPLPERIREALLARVDAASVEKWVQEALIIEAVREGFISRGVAGEMLGLSYFEREQFFADRGLNFDLTNEDWQAQEEDAKRIFGR